MAHHVEKCLLWQSLCRGRFFLVVWRNTTNWASLQKKSDNFMPTKQTQILCPASKGTVFSVFPYCSNLQIEHRWSGWILLILIEWFNTQTFASFIFLNSSVRYKIETWRDNLATMYFGVVQFSDTLPKLIGSCHWINEETSAGFLKASWTTSRQVAMESRFRHFPGRCRF